MDASSAEGGLARERHIRPSAIGIPGWRGNIALPKRVVQAEFKRLRERDDTAPLVSHTAARACLLIRASARSK